MRRPWGKMSEFSCVDRSKLRWRRAQHLCKNIISSSEDHCTTCAALCHYSWHCYNSRMLQSVSQKKFLMSPSFPVLGKFIISSFWSLCSRTHEFTMKGLRQPHDDLCQINTKKCYNLRDELNHKIFFHC